MSIVPLPVFEADSDPHHRSELTDREQYEKLEPPKTIVVKFGTMKLVGEYSYDGSAKPGCGTKLVVRTHRGTELAEMLTTTCENAGCGKSVTRKELLKYIEGSGGKEYPFYSRGKILRVATIEDLNKHSALESDRSRYVKTCRRLIQEQGLDMKLVEVEPILGGELVTFYYMAEGRIDFRDLVRELANEFTSRIEMRQVGARDEARLTADYERCGQYCCCKSFLKVLRPVSMKSAKVQKATLDPLKISGRCGRLMCCLRYEDQTYKELKAKLPRKTSRVGTVEGPGTVVDSKILVQLVLVRLEHDNREIAVAVEDLMDPETCPKAGEVAAAEEAMIGLDPLRGMPVETVKEKVDRGETPPERRKKRRRRRGRKKGGAPEGSRAEAPRGPADRAEPPAPAPRKKDGAGAAGPTEGGKKKRRRRRRGGRRGQGGRDGGSGGGSSDSGGGGGAPS